MNKVVVFKYKNPKLELIADFGYKIYKLQIMVNDKSSEDISWKQAQQ